MQFYLGTHMPHWLKKDDAPPLFVSTRRLERDKSLPVARNHWALDSGGFTELSMYGEWRTTPGEYAARILRYINEIGLMDWAAPQDWMCEPWILAKTGRTVAEHQALTIDSFVGLASQELPVIPVLQGWTIDDYLEHLDQYAARGIDLARFPTVGIGSVCRRESTSQIGTICSTLASCGLKLHGFGVKGAGIARYGQHLTSADSMAWSYGGRCSRPCPHGTAASCANCYTYALNWRANVLHQAQAPTQLELC